MTGNTVWLIELRERESPDTDDFDCTLMHIASSHELAELWYNKQENLDELEMFPDGVKVKSWYAVMTDVIDGEVFQTNLLYFIDPLGNKTTLQPL